MMKMILSALKDALLSYMPTRSLIESMIKYDFKVGNARTHLMELCFSNLAAWPLFLLIGLIFLDPFKGSWSLVHWFGYESSIVLALLNGHMAAMVTCFFVFFVMEWLLRKEYLWIGLIFYFLNRSELHIHLAVSGVLGVYFARVLYVWWLAIDIKSKTQQIWKWVNALQFSVWVITAVVSLIALDFLQVNHLFNQAIFSESLVVTRGSFLLAVVFLFHLLSHVFLCVWGHFYYQIKTDPADLPIYYSTANWILRFSMSYHLQSILKKVVPIQIEKHSENVQKIEGLTASHAGLESLPVNRVLRQELDYLREANLRLTKI
ncbi:hypothetical protein [Pseudobdellovibrio exovorus]|uniref:Uncharacterized protein n=1 Tax=Pseudobdellovibrio exovorus JSS TaxID=1184267 RepID=M4VCV4_9BACT|nr:hypothetical protein [Pseudobdellovibrio exovorus]AGH96320.1 hypothetical protein A11Q_2104 [Pseudobdellovibrio exovorus JSS]